MKRYLVFLLFVLGGCAIQKAPVEFDTLAKKKNTPSDKAIVYVMRASAFGAAVRGVINCDNLYIGSIAGHRYLVTVQEPGKHSFSGLAENESKIELYLEPGKIYYLEELMTMGRFYARNKMVQLSESEGKRKLNNCKLSAECLEKI